MKLRKTERIVTWGAVMSTFALRWQNDSFYKNFQHDSESVESDF